MRVDRKRIPSLKKKLVNLNIEIDELYEQYHAWYCFDRKLSEFEIFVLILEDRRFFSHSGVDILSVAREIFRMLTLRKFGGASTIEMQFIRTVNNRKELTLYRKTREMIVAWLSSYHFNKIALLRSYLSIAFFGSGLNGAEKAAEVVFGISPKQLTGHDAAFLAAMLVYPRPLAPSDAWRARVLKRASYAVRLKPRLEKRFEKIPASEIIDI